uniref:Saposin B-type domain-containing protein n=1 Tax=Steinernema glaseri TaxID=37863 RepID=A0A1I7YLI5_9BILA
MRHFLLLIFVALVAFVAITSARLPATDSKPKIPTLELPKSPLSCLFPNKHICRLCETIVKNYQNTTQSAEGWLNNKADSYCEKLKIKVSVTICKNNFALMLPVVETFVSKNITPTDACKKVRFC